MRLFELTRHPSRALNLNLNGRHVTGTTDIQGHGQVCCTSREGPRMPSRQLTQTLIVHFFVKTLVFIYPKNGEGEGRPPLFAPSPVSSLMWIPRRLFDVNSPWNELYSTFHSVKSVPTPFSSFMLCVHIKSRPQEVCLVWYNFLHSLDISFSFLKKVPFIFSLLKILIYFEFQVYLSNII